VYLDHVALGTRDASAVVRVLVADLGGALVSGGRWSGFQSVQVHMGDGGSGMKVELLEPWGIEANDFLERFLTRHGEGPHHLTFKVDDIEATLARVRGAGFTPVSVDLSNPGWMEAFLQPREAHGTVVQLAQSDWPVHSPLAEYDYALEHGPMEEPRWWEAPPPSAPTDRRATLRRVVLATPSLPSSSAFFSGLLGGTEVGGGEGWIELEWPGGGHVRLEQRVDVGPGIDRLELDGPGPARELDVAGTRLALAAP
jgi:catechol 2,3-dioxygenase-like lactoylglutathione lyase family enzyme